MSTMEVHDGEPVTDGQVEDPIPPRAAIAFVLDEDATADGERMFGHQGSVGQVVLYMVPQHQERAQPVATGNDSLVLRVDEVVPLIRYLLDAYATRVEGTIWDLAAGGCRTCRNTRTVWDGRLGANGPCPTCGPRAEERIRARLWFRRWGRRR